MLNRDDKLKISSVISGCEGPVYETIYMYRSITSNPFYMP